MKYNIVILAGGFGTRLKELGESTPKGLLKTSSNTLIGELCTAINDLPEVANTVLVTNARFYQQYLTWCKTNDQPRQTQILNDGATSPDLRLGALGDLELAMPNLDHHYPTLVLPSDTYFTFALAELTKLYEQYQSFTTVIYELPKEQIANRLGCAQLEGDRVLSFEEKPAEPKDSWACAPFYVYSPDILKRLPEYRKAGNNMDAPSHIIPWLLEQQVPVYALKVDLAIDVGTQDDVSAVANK